MDNKETKETFSAEEAKQTSTEFTPPANSTKHHSKKPLLLALLLAVLVIGGATSYLVYGPSDESDNNESAANITVQQDALTEDNNSDQQNEQSTGIVKYINNEYGFEFSYPEKWGEVKIDTATEEAGTRILGTFTDERDISFGASTKDFQPFGRDGGCSSTIIGVREESKLSQIQTKETDEIYRNEGDAKPSDYRTITGPLFVSETTAIGEKFEAGTVNGIGACPGYSAEAMVIFNDTAKTHGVIFSYNTKENSTNGVPLEWADDYLEDPGYYYDTEVLEQFIETVKTVTAL